jgi:hypothetical protein
MNYLEPAFLEVAENEIARISQWFHKAPMLVSPARCEELHTLQQLLYRAIRFFVAHYDEYASLMPLSPKGRRIVEIASQRPYRTGTYRPDFVIGQDKAIRVCEIGCRFPLDGFFNAGVTELIACRLAAEQGMDQPPSRYRRFLDHLTGYFGPFERVCALKSPADRPMDLRLYTQIFEKSGIPCTVHTPAEIARQPELLSGAAVIDEFNQMDLETLDDAIIAQLAAANSLNDLRTKFLIHDKRFLSVLTNQDFLAQFLNADEIAFLTQHIAPTYTRSQRPDLWEQARADKDGWIIKPYLLGKSAGILAGWVTEEEQWQHAFQSPDIEKMVLQPFFRQKQFVAPLGGRMYMDYVVGTFLCFEDEFLGPGRFRTSSFPVTNQGDDRKVAPLVIEQPGLLKSPFVL